MSRRSRRTGGDEGVSLVIVLVFLTVVGLFAAAALGKSSTTSALVTQLRARGSLQYALDGGVDRALQVLRDEIRSGSPLSCTAPPTVSTLAPFSLNGQTVTPTCTTVAGRAVPASDPTVTHYALVLTSSAAGSFTTQGGVSTPLQIGGSVYLDGPVADSDLKKPVQVVGGDIVSPASRPTCASDLAGLTQLSLLGSGGLRTCTEQTLAQALPTVALPAAPTFAASASLGSGLPVGVAGGTCQVFYPGVYTSPPALAANNYFVSGVYLFSGTGAFSVTGGSTVLGGQRSLSTDTATGTGPCSGMTDAVAMGQPGVAPYAGAIAPSRLAYGTTWVFAGVSSLNLVNGSVSLFTPPAGGSAQPVNVIGVSAAAPGYVPVPAGSGLLTGGNNNTNLEINAAMYAPASSVSIFSTNNTLAIARGGLVASSVALNASTSGSGGVVISTPPATVTPPPAFRAVRVVTSDASGQSTATNTCVATISNFSPYSIHIRSWRTG